jgi:hypothetical protein
MKPANGLPQLHLVGSGAGRNRIDDPTVRLKLVLARLEESRVILADTGERETAQLVDLALLQLRMRMNHIGGAELKALCDAVDFQLDSTFDQSKASGERSL